MGIPNDSLNDGYALEFSYRPDVPVSYGEETITESNLLELRRRHSDVVHLRTLTRHQESKLGGDWEWYIVGRKRTLKMRVQAKRVTCNDMLRIAVYSVLHARSNPEADLGTAPPGSDWDYLDGDGMVMVSSNHCLLMLSGLHPKSMERYLQLLLERGREKGADLPDRVEHVALIQIADPNAVREIRKQGVKSIDLDIGQYLETARDDDEAISRKRIVERLGINVLLDLLTKEEDRRSIEEAENVNARLVISLDTRRPGLDAERFGEMVWPAAEEAPSDVTVKTESGQRLKRGNLVLSKPVKVSAFGKTVRHEEAWFEVGNYFHYLASKGILEF